MVRVVPACPWLIGGVALGALGLLAASLVLAAPPPIDSGWTDSARVDVVQRWPFLVEPVRPRHRDACEDIAAGGIRVESVYDGWAAVTDNSVRPQRVLHCLRAYFFCVRILVCFWFS